MSHHAVNLLRDRSLRMLNSAKRNLSSGDYNMAIFMADQSLQLYLKLVILELTGEIPANISLDIYLMLSEQF